MTQSSLFIFADLWKSRFFANVCPALLALQFFCLHLPTASFHHRIPVVQRQSFLLIRPRVSLTILIGANFHYADEGGPVEHHTLGRREFMLLLCTTLFGTLAALHTRHPPRHTFPHCSLSHFFLQRTRMHNEITHRALGPMFIMYKWVYPLGAWCPGWKSHRSRVRPQRLSAVDRGLAAVGGAGGFGARRRPGSGPVHALCGLQRRCASSQSGSATDKPPAEVSCADSEAEQRGEERVEQHTCPHR